MRGICESARIRIQFGRRVLPGRTGKPAIALPLYGGRVRQTMILQRLRRVQTVTSLVHELGMFSLASPTTPAAIRPPKAAAVRGRAARRRDLGN